jgi:hypothetical protein
MRLDPDALFSHFAVQVAQAIFQPGAPDADLEVLQAELQKVGVGKRSPSKSTRHGASDPANEG